MIVICEYGHMVDENVNDRDGRGDFKLSRRKGSGGGMYIVVQDLQ